MNEVNVNEKKGQRWKIIGMTLDTEIHEFNLESRTYSIPHLIRSTSLSCDKEKQNEVRVEKNE